MRRPVQIFTGLTLEMLDMRFKYFQNYPLFSIYFIITLVPALLVHYFPCAVREIHVS